MREKILSDHFKNKKKLKPPLNYHFNFLETNHANEVIPEVFWLDLYYEKFGLKATVDFVTLLTELTSEIKSEVDLFNCCLISNYEKLLEKDKKELKQKLKLTVFNEKLNIALNGFNYFFPNSPISFLLNNSRTNKKNFIKSLKKTISNLYNRVSVNTTYTLANVIYSEGISGHLVINSDVERLDMNELLHYPNTEESKRVAAFVRTAIKPIIRMSIETDHPTWHRVFWETCFKIEPCRIQNLTDHEP